MSGTARHAPPAGEPVPAAAPAPRVPPRVWVRDLLMGARFALEGGREGWVRTLLTGVGVGLGVTVLLLASAFPGALHNRDVREKAREEFGFGTVAHKSDDTLLTAVTDTTFRGADIRGRVLVPEGPHAPRPPGVAAYPGPGGMVVSPALKKLLADDDSALLRRRLPFRITGTIAARGLAGPGELAYYARPASLNLGDPPGDMTRINRFGTTHHRPELDPVLLVLIMVVIVVLLMPVGVFVAAAVRFGGERRDRRLAALRLIGADGPMVRRTAAGEALAGAVSGLALGACLFAVARQLAGHVTLFGNSFFPSDLNPSPALAALICLAVPAAAVVVTLFALRSVVIEPLGVVRAARPPRRRLWWRLLLPLCGLAMLAPMIGQSPHGRSNQWLVTGGTVLLLVGVTILLPWVVEAVVGRLHGGPVSWQLAVRRLQLDSGAAARMVNGIAVAVAGAVALQMLFTNVSGSYIHATGDDVRRAQLAVDLPTGVPAASTDRALSGAAGVRHTTVVGTAKMAEHARGSETFLPLTVGSCADLREAAHVPGCREGDSFVLTDGAEDADTRRLTRPHRTLYVDPTIDGIKGEEIPFRLPGTLKPATARTGPHGNTRSGVLVTPSALPERVSTAVHYLVRVRLDESVPDVVDRVRTISAQASPVTRVYLLEPEQVAHQFAAIRNGLYTGAAGVLVVVGASMLVTQLEQLRERRRLLAVLVAFGTRRRTLSLSVLWQAAVPVVLGMLLASAVGLALGRVLLEMLGESASTNWAGVTTMAAAGGGVILAVTGLSVPVLVRVMRPEGLRTE